MIRYLYGRPGRGKFTYIAEEIKRTKKIRGNVLIIPVGETVNIDKRIAKEGISGYVDVYTIPLLCKEIFLRKGGNGKSRISKSGKKMLMYKILAHKDDKLNMFGNISKNDEKAVEHMLTLYRECAENNIDIVKLASAREKLTEKDAVLSRKLEDICRIFSEYNALVEAKWSNGEWDTVRAAKTDNDVCKGKNVYIYGFNSLSESEMMLLENVLSKADNICVSFKYDKDTDKEVFDFNSQLRLKKRFDISFAKMNETYGTDQKFGEDICLKENKKYTNEELKRLTGTLFLPVDENNMYENKPEHIRVYSCSDKREECESVCCDISKSILESEKNGEDLRFANCAVVASGIADYEKELETAFEKYSIPFYMVDEKDIRNEPIIQYIFKCLDCLTYDFQMSDVLSLVKNGFFDSENDEKDLFEKYMLKWEIKGFKSYEKPWTNSPLGFDPRNDEYILSVLEKVNGVREKIYNSFSLFIKDKKKVQNAEDHSRRLYKFLLSQNIVKRIKEKSDEISKTDSEEGQKLIDIWTGVINCLDEIVDTFEKDDLFDTEEYIQIIRMCLSEIHARSSKTTLDRVISGSVDKVRFGGVKNLYILGVNDGVFPGSKRETGCLTEKEKETLNSTEVLTITDTREKRIFDEIMKFYSVLCIPDTELIMTYHTHSDDFDSSGKSIGITYTEEIFPNLEETVFENVSTDRIWKSDQAFENMIYFSGAKKQAVFDLYKEKRGDYDDRISSFNMDSLSVGEYRIDDDLAKEIFSKNRIETSYSQIQKYISCQYEYFCEKYLGAHDDDKASFAASNEGSLMHLIMEKSVDTVKKLVEDKYGEPDFDNEFDTKVNELIETNTEEYLKSLMYDSKTMTTEFKNQIGFLKKAAYRALSDAKNLIKDSIFKPMYYELRITGKPDDGSGEAYIEPVTIEKAGSETSLVINGIIDRVDLYDSPDGKTYVKVVDYKSSEKKLSLEMVKKGINTQMLLYLFSIKENGIKSSDGKVLLDKTKVVPAGTVYMHVDSGIRDSDYKPDANNALVLDDFKDNIGKEVKISEKSKENSCFTFENPSEENDFENIKKAVSEKLVDLIDEGMRRGEANTFTVLFTEKEADKLKISPCKYCKFKAVCRNSQKQY